MNKGTSKPVKDAQHPTASDLSDPALAAPTAAKQGKQRKTRWGWNGRLALISLAILLSVGAASAISYRYNSSQAATTLLQRAEAALEQQDYADQALWLSRYSLLRPDDLDSVVRMARAADMAVDKAEPQRRAEALVTARRQLGTALARIGDTDAAATTDLRRRLIKRLLQLGGVWSKEAETQVILLGAPRDDSEATRWLALALVGQVRAGMYTDRFADEHDEKQEYWEWLASQKVGDVLARAVQQDIDDIELASAFLDVYVSNSNLFDRSEEPEDKSRKLATQVEEILAKLRANQDGRSKLVLYQFQLAQGNDQQASELLREAAQASSQRLANLNQSDPAADAGSVERPPYFWDYLVVREGARRFAQQDAELAARWFDQLMSLQLAAIPASITEQVYLDAGRLSAAGGNRDQAIEIWERGLRNVNSDSLALLEPLTEIGGEIGANDDFVKSLNRFRDAIEIASLELSRAGANISSAARTARGRQIERSKWKLGVLESLVAVRDGRRVDGIDLLSAALNSTVDVGARERVAVARQLASLYSIDGFWDKAAATLDRATELAPEDQRLRLLASEAWAQAGNSQEAIDQWRAAGGAGSLVGQLAGAESAFSYQLRLIPEQRDLSEVRAAIKRIRKRLDAEVAAEGEQTAGVAGRLSILEISLPDSGILVEEHLNSPGVADALAELAKEYADDQDVQIFVAERLASMDRDQESQAALDRLSLIVGESDSSLAMVKARIKAASDDPLGAAQDLIAQSQIDLDGADALLNLAASFAARGDNAELAYEAIMKIPDDRRSLSTRFRLCLLAKALPANSAFLTRDGTEISPLDLSKQWEDQLRQVEGQQGTYWRYVNALRVIDQLRSDPNRIEDDDPRWVEANQLVREILAVRPNWGTAISLQGWLSALVGNRQKAVGQLRAGLAAGDRRLETRQLLWGQLSLLNRWREADEELRRTELATAVDIDRYGAIKIDMALRQQDFAKSLQLAESGIEQRPDDFLSYLVLSNTARLTAQNAKTPEERSQLLQRASWAIDQASKLAANPEPSIYSARLQLALTSGEETEVSQEISRLQASELNESTKLRLIGRTRANQRDYGAAIEALERAQQLEPSNEALVDLAEIYRRMRRPDDEISALRLAYNARPNDAALASRLARSIAARDGKEVDWNEISTLLSSGSGVTAGNRLLYAILLATGGASGGTPAQDSVFQGSEQQQAEAATILRELIEDRNSSSDDAARVLAPLLQERLKLLTQSESDAALRQQWLDEVRSIYESLIDNASPQVADIYRYALFLLESGDDADNDLINQLQQRLQSSAGGVVATLDLGIRITTRDGNVDQAPEFVQSWADSAIKDGTLTDDRAASIAGASLLRLGLDKQAFEWLDRAYRENPETLANYAAALVNSGKTLKSVDVCASHFETHGDARSAILFVESLIAAKQPKTSSRHQAMIKRALATYEKNAPLLDGVATLLMNQQSYPEAALIYQRALKIDPRRLRAWNNLAMTLSEIPGRQSDAIEPIDRAIGLVGEVPELLDTKGVVLMRAGRLDDAEATLEKAISELNDPRFQFHLIVTLLAQNREADAQRKWASEQLGDLGPEGLMPSEVETLNRLKQKFGSENDPSKTL